MQIEILSPHGFCAGVRGALAKASALASKGVRPAYCLHEIVHNSLVVRSLREKGFVFVESIDEIPAGSTVLFSAHGVSPAVRAAAIAKRLEITDATCPFVSRVHRDAAAFAARGMGVIVIGHADHTEVAGIKGEAGGASFSVASPSEARSFVPPPGAPSRFGIVSQTTMNADEVREISAILAGRFDVEISAGVCNATKERQDAARAFDGDALLVLGSATSSNTRRLCEVSRAARVFRAGDMEELSKIDFTGVSRLGVTGGASTPEAFLEDAVGSIAAAYQATIIKERHKK